MQRRRNRYYRTLLDGALTFSTETLSGSKTAEDSVTVLVTANVDGTDKRPLLIIGKTKQPRCFRGVPQLPTPYTNSTSAWTTGSIFRKWLADFNREMTKERCCIALVVDNCAAHPKDSADELFQIRLFLLPPNVTAVIQPCDMGIIRNLKAIYRKNVVSRIIMQIDGGSSIPISKLASSITQLDAMHMLEVSWQCVKQSSVVNCFAKAGFIPVPPCEVEETEQPPDGMTLHEFQAYVDVDSSVECHGELTDEEICASVHQSDPQPVPATKPREVLQAMSSVRAFMEQNGADLSMFYTLESRLLKLIADTTSIRDFSLPSSPEY